MKTPDEIREAIRSRTEEEVTETLEALEEELIENRGSTDIVIEDSVLLFEIMTELERLGYHVRKRADTLYVSIYE